MLEIVIEKSVSKSQQRLFGMAVSIIDGEKKLSDYPEELQKTLKEIIDGMSSEEIKKFAKTKTGDLPKKVLESIQKYLKEEGEYASLDSVNGEGDVVMGESPESGVYGFYNGEKGSGDVFGRYGEEPNQKKKKKILFDNGKIEIFSNTHESKYDATVKVYKGGKLSGKLSVTFHSKKGIEIAKGTKSGMDVDGEWMMAFDADKESKVDAWLAKNGLHYQTIYA